MSIKNAAVGEEHWKNIYDFISACGSANDPKSLVVELLNRVGQFCSFDQALVYFFDGNGNVCDQHLVNLEKRWSTLYLEHYFDVENERYSCFSDLRLKLNKVTYIRDWDKENSTEFVPALILPRGLKYTCAFVLHDLNGSHRAIIALDRVKKKNFGNDELLNLQLAVPLLNNLFKNFFFTDFQQEVIKQSIWETRTLTAREAEVAGLLCQGISPTNISRKLCISSATTYKHIANIYKKMHVSSKQELLVRLLRQSV